MPSPEPLESFVAAVTGGDFVGAIERYYLEDATMQENQAPPRGGRDALVANERGVMAAFKEISAEIVGAPLVAGDRVAIQWKFAFTPHEGAARTLQEIAWQRWQG